MGLTTRIDSVHGHAPIINRCLEANYKTERDEEKTQSPLNHFKNLVRPTLETNQKGWDRFVSVSGRGYCLVRLAEYTVSIPFRLLSTITKIVLTLGDTFRNLLTLPFNWGKSIADLMKNGYKFLDASVSLLVMPLSVPLDIVKLALGTVIHPIFGIATVPFDFGIRRLTPVDNKLAGFAPVYLASDNKEIFVDKNDNIIKGNGRQTAMITDANLNLNNVNCILDKNGAPLFRV